MNYLAQTEIRTPGIINGIGNLGTPEGEAGSLFNNVIQSAVGLITVVAFIYFLFQLLSGALAYISAGGDKGKVEDARAKITTGIIGLVIVIAAIFIVDLIGFLLGIESILDPGSLIEGLSP